MGVIGRDAALAAGDAFLDAAEKGPAVLALEGEAGIGKTTVWQEILSRAEARGFLVLACRPAEVETKLGLSALTDLLGPVPAEIFAGLPDPQRAALDSALLRSTPEAAPPEARALATAVRSALAALSDDRPLLIGVDDTQWLDRASAMVLSFAVRRLTDKHIAWVFSRRVNEEARLDPGRLVAAEMLTRIDLGPLTLAAIHHVILSHVEHSLTRPILVRAHQVSGGNPFYAIEIARELLRERTGSTPVPRDVRDLLAKRLQRLPSETRNALLVASALSDPTTDGTDDAALEPAERAGIVRVRDDRKIEFTHPLFAAAVYDAATHAERRRVHEKLAARSTDAEEHARHIAAATADPSEEVARIVEEGAYRARSRGSWESAGELLERAHDLTPTDSEEAARRWILAAEHYVHAGDRSRARALLENTLTGQLQASARARALRVLAEIAYHDEGYEEAARLFEEASQYAEDLEVSIATELGLAYLSSWSADYERGTKHAERAVELAQVAGDSALVAQGLAYSVLYGFLSGLGTDWLRLKVALELEDPDRIVPIWARPSVVDAYLQLFHGRHSIARDRMTGLVNRAIETGDESDLAFLLIWFSWMETRCGNSEIAAELAERAISTARLTGSKSMEAWAQMQRAYVGAQLGEVQETRDACALAMEQLNWAGGVMLVLWIAATSALLERSLGNAEAAWNACMPLVSVLEQQGIAEPIPLFFLPDAIEALIVLEDLDRAERILDAFEGSARRLDRVWALATGARCRSLLLAARGDLAGAVAAADGALAEHERIELPLERGRSLLAKGIAERRLRKRAKARNSFEAALATFERIGAPLWTARAQDELRHLGLRRAVGDELTEAERRVAELTAQGKTRREVAAALFISAKTVDATLVRVYRKLGVGSRAELGARIGRLQE